MPGANHRKWMDRRRGESKAHWQARLNRTCYACGTEFTDMQKCDEHERRNHGGSKNQ